MHPATRAGLRWVGALVGLAVLVALTIPAAVDAFRDSVVLGSAGADDPAPQARGGRGGTGPRSGTPVQDGSSQPAADFVVRVGQVDDLGETTMAVGSDAQDAFVLAFDRIRGDVDCLGTVTLEAQVIEATPAEITVRPGSLFRAKDVEQGEDVDDPVLREEPGVLAITDGTPGFLSWDVTEVYREAVVGEGVPERVPAVLVLQPRSPDGGSAAVRFAGVEAGEEDAARLRWTGVENCGS